MFLLLEREQKWNQSIYEASVINQEIMVSVLITFFKKFHQKFNAWNISVLHFHEILVL